MANWSGPGQTRPWEHRGPITHAANELNALALQMRWMSLCTHLYKSLSSLWVGPHGFELQYALVLDAKVTFCEEERQFVLVLIGSPKWVTHRLCYQDDNLFPEHCLRSYSTFWSLLECKKFWVGWYLMSAPVKLRTLQLIYWKNNEWSDHLLTQNKSITKLWAPAIITKTFWKGRGGGESHLQH